MTEDIVMKPTDTVRYVPFNKETITVRRGEDGLWRDDSGCIWAFEEDATMTDKTARIGVWPFVFPRGTVLDGPAKVHDYMYSCPAWQAFHTRLEADTYLREQELLVTEQAGSWLRVFATPFYYLSRWFGGKYWDNPKTR